MNPLLAVVVLGPPPFDASMGARIVDAYRAVRRKSPGRFPYKTQRIGSEIQRLEDLPSVTPSEAPRYVAYRALRAEWGDLASVPKGAVPLFARYGPAVRAKWSPEAQRLWEEAFYTNFTPKAAIDALRRAGQDVGALEAHFIGYHGPKPELGYPPIVRLLDYAEIHPKDIVASSRAAFMLRMETVMAPYEKRPVRADLIRRTLALYPRTLRNLNALMDEHLPSLLYFRLLEETARKTGVSTS